jgi:hypothetical protein
MQPISYARYQHLPEVIRHAVWLGQRKMFPTGAGIINQRSFSIAAKLLRPIPIS